MRSESKYNGNKRTHQPELRVFSYAPPIHTHYRVARITGLACIVWGEVDAAVKANRLTFPLIAEYSPANSNWGRNFISYYIRKLHRCFMLSLVLYFSSQNVCLTLQYVPQTLDTSGTLISIHTKAQT